MPCVNINIPFHLTESSLVGRTQQVQAAQINGVCSSVAVCVFGSAEVQASFMLLRLLFLHLSARH